MDKISVIVPCFNEEEVLPLFYKEVVHTLEKIQNIDYEILFINDGSQDHSEDILKLLAHKNKHCFYYSFSRNFGKEAAIYAGLHYATGTYLSIIDADLQQDPEIVKHMTEILEKKGLTATAGIGTNLYLCKIAMDIVAKHMEPDDNGVRIAELDEISYRELLWDLSEVDLRENASDFRTFRRNVQEALLDMPEYFRFSKGLFSWVGFETEYIPYVAAERFAGTTKWSFAKLIKYAMEGVISFSTMPLQLATFCGALVSVFAIVYGIIIIAHTLLTGIDVPGYATTIVVVLFLGGIQLLVMGILGEYLAKTYIQGKHRPVYVVKKVLEKKE